MAAILDFQSERSNLLFVYKLPQYFLPSFDSVGLLVQEKKSKIDCQDGGKGGHLGFCIGKILAMFDLHASFHFSSKFAQRWRSGMLLKEIVDAARGTKHDER